VAEKKAGASKASTAASPQRKAGEWSEAAKRVLRERYLLKDAQGVVIETADDMAWRVAEAVASAEKQWTNKGGSSSDAIAEQFYSVMVERKFLPNSPTLMNAGKGNNLQLSACYVVPVEDSLPGIFEAVKHAALIHQSGGGTGFSFSRLRPEGSMVASTHGVASGPISFMKIFDGATEAVKQGGTRRGANMGILRVDHPDILKFIDCKRDGSVTNFNISVAITDTFMRALEANTEYELIEPHSNLVTGTLKARDVMDAIVSAAWATGDPALSSSTAPTPAQPTLSLRSKCWKQPIHVGSNGSVRMTPATLARSTLACLCMMARSIGKGWSQSPASPRASSTM
jgi:ribonucleoside-diphosphate reductase alpha chain